MKKGQIKPPLLLTTIILMICLSVQTTGQVSPDSVKRVTAVRDAYPDWSPDCKQIVFQSDRNSSSQEDFEIYFINVDGSNLRRLTYRPGFSDESPVWSPDGKKILFASYLDSNEGNNDLFIMNTDGSDLTQLTFNPARDGHQKFSPDGKRIIFCSQRDDEGINPSRNYEIYEMDVDGANIKRLTNFIEWDTYPSISPDGEKIVWRRILPTGGSSSSGHNSEIFLMNRDGTNPVNISNHPSFDGYPAWSPDGSKIVFASNREDENTRGNFHIYIMNADGTNPVRVLENDENVEDARPVWSPDGTKILFNRQYIANESSMDILIINLPEELVVHPLK